MWKTIDRIRRKPKAVRNRYAFLISATITSLIALVWLASMWAKFNNQTAPTAENSGPSPFSELKDKFGDVKDLFDESFSSASDDGSVATGSDTLSQIIEEMAADDYDSQGSIAEVGVIGAESPPEVSGATTSTADGSDTLPNNGSASIPGTLDTEQDPAPEPVAETPASVPVKIVQPVIIVTPSDAKVETGTNETEN